MKTDNTSKLLIIVTAIFVLSLMMSCVEEPLTEEPTIENEMLDSIIETESIEGDDNCPNGGFILKAGNDSNSNGVLEENEITTINYLCHGENGQIAANLLTITEEKEPDANCAEGGVTIYFGLDLNNDLVLTEEEIQSSFFLCHGGQGQDGSNGINGMLTLIKVIDEPAGENCANGGLLLQTGVDTNANGELDDSEIETNKYVCDGESTTSEYYEYYFSNGLENYSGTSDVSITKLSGEGIDEEYLEIGSELNPSNGFMYPTNSLIHFEGVESILTDLADENFEIVEAVLYIRVETPFIDGGAENALGVQVIVPNAPLFSESEANWNMAYTDQEWFDPGTAAIESSAYDYSDMILLPDPTRYQFKGVVPMLLNRSQIKSWIDSKDNNKGLVLTLVDQSMEYDLTIASSEHEELAYRPMLYIKVKKIETGARGRAVSDSEYQQLWFLKSITEKMQAYHNIF